MGDPKITPKYKPTILLKRGKVNLNVALTRKHTVFLFVVLTSVYYLVFWALADMKDTASFGGDTWEYQSMGVNFAKGHGIQKFGGLEPFETYKFENLTPFSSYYNNFIVDAGRDIFYRTPAYPLFLGVVYRSFGISPRTAKAFQLLMLVIIATSLPFIGYHYWGRSGFIGGLPAGGLFLATNYRLAQMILTESLIAFAVFLVLVALMAYERRRRVITACMLGVSLGFALLVKGSLIFLPILTGIVILISTVVNRDPGGLKRLLVIMASAILTVLPWSLYASAKSGALIVLSTQGGSQLLDDNNEFCTNGRWHPEWVDKKDSFYNTDGIDRERVVAKVVNFYWQHPVLFPRLMFQKLLKGFGPLPFLWLFTAFVLLDGMCRVANRWVKSDLSKVTCFSTLLLMSVLACLGVYHFDNPIGSIVRWIPSGWWILKLAGVLIVGWLAYLLMTKRAAVQIPVAFWVLGVNFLLITLLFHAERGVVKSRLVAPMDFILALICCVAGVRLFSDIYRKLHESNKRIKEHMQESPLVHNQPS